MHLVGQSDAYTVEQVAARGSAATVYRGRRDSDGEAVALKVFDVRLHAADSLFKEISHQMRLSHPGILPILDFGHEQLAQPRPRGIDGASDFNPAFWVMPFCEEGDLAQMLPPYRNFVPAEEATRLLSRLAEAVDFVHANGILHGDIKPHNVMMSCGGTQPRLTDFGLSTHIDQQWASTIIPAEDHGGTPDYMSPEQLEGRQATQLSDIYAVGMIAYEMLAGSKPYPEDTPLYPRLYCKVHGQLADPRESNPRLNEGTARVLLRCLSPTPQDRPSSCTDFVQELQDALGDHAPARQVDQEAPLRNPVFISHSTRDRAVARVISEKLEHHGIPCWLAERDILPGKPWTEAIVGTIRTASAFVLVFSEHAAASEHVIKEVTIALEAGQVVIPFKLQNVAVATSLAYALANTQWLNATDPPLEERVDDLADVLRRATS